MEHVRSGEKFVAHLNLGARYESDADVARLTWGVGAEGESVFPLYTVVEIYGDSSSDSFTQIGARLWLAPETVQIDATDGRQLGMGRDQEWFTVGLRFLSRPFFFLGGDA